MVIIEYQRIRTVKQLDSIIYGDDTLNISTILVLNYKSLNKHALDIASDSRLATSDNLYLTKTQIEDGALVNNVLDTLHEFSIHFNNCHYKYLGMSYGIKQTVNVRDYEYYRGMPFVKFSPQFYLVTLNMIVL